MLAQGVYMLSEAITALDGHRDRLADGEKLHTGSVSVNWERNGAA